MILLAAFFLNIYHVSLLGDDSLDGKSPRTAWKTVAKVNATRFEPGDQILFERGGEWRESLRASSSGLSGKPILYGAYDSGKKPRFWGSDVLDPGGFAPRGGKFELPCPARVAAVLVDHEFLSPGSWSWEGGTLTVDRDPRGPKHLWTACVRVDCVHSNGKDHLVFRDLVADESADARDGYGFRVMGSDDVRLENCEAYRAGRHHFGVINSTRFVGQGLHAELAMPRCPGGATFYVSFSDASRKLDTHQWIDCTAERFESPGERNYQVFYDHGEGLGPILIRNLKSKGGKLSVGSSAQAPITIERGEIEDNALEIFGDHCHVDGLVIRGDGAVDQFGSDSLFENMLLDLRPRQGGPTGYGAGFVLREKASRNTIRFSTVRVEGDEAVKPLGGNAETRIYGSVLLSRNPLDPRPLAFAQWNFTSGDPKLGADFIPMAGSPLIRAAKVDGSMRPVTDLAGKKRPELPSMGAFEPH